MAYEIYHHGILGQKWGVRRYQNPDGSYKAGKSRRNTKDEPGDTRYNIKKDSNGISYGRAKSREDIENLGDCMTIEGLKINDDRDRKMLYDFLNSKGVDTKNLEVIEITGKDMNKAFNLTGDNAYTDDFHFQVFSGLDADAASRTLRPLGCRWMEDIIGNNERREQEMRHSIDDYLEHRGVLGQRWEVRRVTKQESWRFGKT